MIRSLRRGAVPLGLLFLLTGPIAAIAQSDNGATKVPRTPWGHPDLQGVWDYRTSTPLERPEDQNAGTVLTDDAAATFAQRQRDAAAARRVRTLNADWSDKWESGLAGGRTALIVDPPSGRRPPLTPDRLLLEPKNSGWHGRPDGARFMAPRTVTPRNAVSCGRHLRYGSTATTTTCFCCKPRIRSSCYTR